MQKLVFTIISLSLLITGCQQPNTTQTQNNNTIAKSPQLTQMQTKVSKAFEDAPRLLKEHSKWFDRVEKLPLTIIATAYIDPDVIKTKEYKAYITLIKNIQKNPSLLGDDIASKYSSIKFIDYTSNEKYHNKFNAAYNNRYNDKDILTDILRPDNEKPSQELLIRLNLEELKKGNLTIEGYKTVKQSNLKRNSYYYTLRKSNYDKLPLKDKNKAIQNSLLATLQLSIPEYVSIDRSKLVKDGDILRFITPNGDATYTGEVWKKDIQSDVESIAKELDKITNNDIKNIDSIVYNTRFNSLAISPDGRYALSGHSDATLNYWDLKTKRIIKSLPGHTGYYTRVSISPDGKYALSGGYNQTIRYWDLQTGETIKILHGHADPIDTLTISPDGKYAFSSNFKYLYASQADYTIRQWDLKTGKITKSFKGHTGDVKSIVVSNDGKYLLSGSSDQTIKYWNIKTGKLIKTLGGNISW